MPFLFYLISARVPSKELWFIRKSRLEESFLAIIIMGIVFVQNITMLDIWKDAQKFIEGITGNQLHGNLYHSLYHRHGRAGTGAVPDEPAGSGLQQGKRGVKLHPFRVRT